MARISVEQKVLSDPRYSILGRLLGYSRHHAIGLMVSVWNECQERESYYLSDAVLNGIFDCETAGDVLEQSELARHDSARGWYIRGTKGRVEWLKKRRKEGQKGGKLGGRPMKPLGVTVGVNGKQRRETPPAPAPALVSSESLSETLQKPPDSSEPVGKPPVPEPVMTFPTVGKGADTWGLPPALVAELQGAFPAVDVVAECSKARAWVHSNPSRRKTPRGMPKFLYGWVERNQNGNGHRGGITMATDNKRHPMLAHLSHVEQVPRGVLRRRELSGIVKADNPEMSPREVENEATRRWKAEGWEEKA